MTFNIFCNITRARHPLQRSINRIYQITPNFTQVRFITMSQTTFSGPVGVVSNDAKTGAKGEPMTPIPSATLIVLCPISSNSQRQQYATLMVQRKASGSFRSATVFPGGLLDKADVYAISETFKQSSSSSSKNSKTDQYLESLRLCALRETFEETGLLLIPTRDQSSSSTFSRAIGPKEAGISSEEWTNLRKSVHDDARAFRQLLHRVNQSSSSSDGIPLPPLAALRHHSNWVTPRTLVRPAKRFDTHFFVTVLDQIDALGQLTSSIKDDEKIKESLPLGMNADGSETTSLRIAKPEELLKMAIGDEIILFPPQYYLLADIHSFLIKQEQSQINFTPLQFGIEQNPEQNTSSDQAPAIQGVSSVEPQGHPQQGGMIPAERLSIKHKKRKSNKGEEEEEDIFVLPLVLPGDELRPITSNQEQSIPPRNRVYVTPRKAGEGGGMMVHGAHRRGIQGLVDFKFGNILPELEGESVEEDDSNGRESKL